MANSYYQRKATIDAINAKKPEALKRDAKTDYTSGFFFVTLNVRDHKPLLGSIVGQVDAITRQSINAGVRLSTLGEKVQCIWQGIPRYYPNVQIIDSVVMPEHFHGLLHLDHVDGKTLSMVIKGFKIGCNRAYKELYSLQSASLFSSGFNETIPITQEEIDAKREYIHDNPRRRLLKSQLSDCFTICRNQNSPNWTIDCIIKGLCHDPFIAHNTDALQTTLDTLTPRLLVDNVRGLTLDYIGLHDLLLSKNKLPLVCHRADANRFVEQSDAVIHAAQNGAVIVSAFISHKEREVLKQLMSMNAHIIEIMDNGFGKTYKPWGLSFDACAEGKLLQITPWSYLYQRETSISRPMCMVMNELARVITGLADDWWK